MGRNINAVIAAIPKARREKVEVQANRLSKEMIAYADSISEVRKAVNKTQRDIGRKLGIGQGAVAQLEKRSDFLLSTLYKYMKAAGVKITLVAHTKDGVKIDLNEFGNAIVKASDVSRDRNTNRGRSAKKRVAASARSH